MENLVYRQAENIITRKVLDDILLVPVSGDIAAMDSIFSLNSVGYFIWQHLDGVNTVEMVNQAILAEFDAPAAVIEEDLLALLADLKARGLICRFEDGKSHA